MPQECNMHSTQGRNLISGKVGNSPVGGAAVKVQHVSLPFCASICDQILQKV